MLSLNLTLAATPPSNPARLTGLRGHSLDAMQVMHAVRDGSFWNTAPQPEATGESYDLVVQLILGTPVDRDGRPQLR